MSRKPNFVTSRDRGDIEIELDDDVPRGGGVVDLDGTDPYALLEIEEIDDTPAADRGRPQAVDDPLEISEEEMRGLGSRTQDRIKRLIFERETERRGREQAERELTTATDHSRRALSENERLRTTVATTTTTLATSMLKEREQAMSVARQKLADAHEAGDNQAIADATAEVSMIASEMTLVKAQTRQAPVADPAAAAAEVKQQPQREQPPQLDPSVVKWISDNRWFNQAGGEEKTAVAMATHSKLIARGIRPGNPDYIKGLDEGLKKLFTDHRTAEEIDNPERSRETQRRGDVVNGGERRAAPSGSRKVSLTASELNLAKKLGVTPQAYAASKVQHEARNKGSAR